MERIFLVARCPEYGAKFLVVRCSENGVTSLEGTKFGVKYSGENSIFCEFDKRKGRQP